MLLNRDHRPGLTLVELMVAIGIILTLATLTALYFPRYQDRESVSRGADQLQGLLLAAKQQARRDGLPTGIRLFVETNAALNQNRLYCRRLAYIQQPDDLSVGMYVGHDAAQTKAWFTLPTGKKFGDSSLPVSPGDYLHIDFGGRMWRIKTVHDNSLDIDDGQRELPGSTIDDSSKIAAYNNEPINYRIRRQPILVPGEQEIALPENVGLDFGTHPKVTDNDIFDNKLLTRNLRAGTNSSYRDILFSPTGGLMGSGTGQAQVILWVRDLTRPNLSDILMGHATLICIQPRTGFIAAHPAGSGSDPYVFTKDARSSGM